MAEKKKSRREEETKKQFLQPKISGQRLYTAVLLVLVESPLLYFTLLNLLHVQSNISNWKRKEDEVPMDIQPQ